MRDRKKSWAYFNENNEVCQVGGHHINPLPWAYESSIGIVLGMYASLECEKTWHLAQELSELIVKGLAHLFLSRGFHWLVFPPCWHLFSSSYGGISCPSWPLPGWLVSWERKWYFPPQGTLPSHSKSIGVPGSSGQRWLVVKDHQKNWRYPGTAQILYEGVFHSQSTSTAGFGCSHCTSPRTLYYFRKGTVVAGYGQSETPLEDEKLI